MNESCRIHEWVMAHTWMSHGTYMNESWHIHEWVMAHTWMSHGTYMNEWRVHIWMWDSKSCSLIMTHSHMNEASCQIRMIPCHRINVLSHTILYKCVVLRRWQDGFYEGKFNPKSASSILQALSCRFCRLKLSNPSKFVISKVWKWRIALLVHNARGLFPDGFSRQKPARLSLPETRPTLFGKIPGGIYEQNETQTNLEC